MKAILALEDGVHFFGESFGVTGSSTGEACFNTSMTGYQEVLTDPSYRGQIVAMSVKEPFPYNAMNSRVNSPFANLSLSSSKAILPPSLHWLACSVALSVCTLPMRAKQHVVTPCFSTKVLRQPKQPH